MKSTYSFFLAYVMWGKFSEYLCITDHDDFGIERFLSPLTIYIYQNLAMETPIINDNLGPNTKEGHERYP